MATSVQFRPQNRDLGMVVREVDEDLAIFLGMRNAEKERNDCLLVDKSLEFDDSKEPRPDSLLTLNASSQEVTLPAVPDDNLLNFETETSDCIWLLTQPDSFLIPSVKIDVQDSAASQTKISDSEGISLKSELEITCEDLSAAANRRPLSSGERKPTRRAATPTGRPVLAAKTKPSRASTPTSRPTLSSIKPVVAASQTRSSTPTRATSRSSTPASRPSIPIVSKSASRSATPTRKPTTPSSTPAALDRSSSGRKMGSTMSKTSMPSRGASPSVESRRPSKPSDVLSLSQNPPQNPKVLMPKRPVSASRGRMSSPATHSSSSNEKSCSPAKVRAPMTTAYKTGSRVLPRSRVFNNDGDDVNPVLMGTKMVDRVVNMRKLAPPKQDEYVSHDNPKKSSQENSGFGRSLSKKSLDMAIRHMDIRRSIPDKLRPVVTGVLSSDYRLPSSYSKGDLSESPLSSNCDSSKSSM